MISNKAKLKKLLTPIIEECVAEMLSDKDLMREVVLNSGVLSTVVREVATGLNESRQQPMFANRLASSGPSSAVSEARSRRESSKGDYSKLPVYEPKRAVAAKKPKPSSEFEKIQENVDRDYSSKRNSYGALAGSDPEDEGVSLASFGMGHASTNNKKIRPENDNGVDLSELKIGRRLR